MFHSIESTTRKYCNTEDWNYIPSLPIPSVCLSGCVQVTNQQESEARQSRKENENPCMLNGSCTEESNKRREV